MCRNVFRSWVVFRCFVSALSKNKKKFRIVPMETKSIAKAIADCHSSTIKRINKIAALKLTYKAFLPSIHSLIQVTSVRFFEIYDAPYNHIVNEIIIWHTMADHFIYYSVGSKAIIWHLYYNVIIIINKIAPNSRFSS